MENRAKQPYEGTPAYEAGYRVGYEIGYFNGYKDGILTNKSMKETKDDKKKDMG